MKIQVNNRNYIIFFKERISLPMLEASVFLTQIVAYQDTKFRKR